MKEEVKKQEMKISPSEVENMTQIFINKWIPQLSLNENMEETLDTIEANIPKPITPEKLTEAIATYIQGHMKYDLISAISCVSPSIFSLLKEDFKTPDTKALFDKIERNPNIQFNAKDRTFLIQNFKKNYEQLKKTSES